jgi:uncharacterized membrane protein
MSKFIVVIFPDETKAYEGKRALHELDAEGSLTLYAMAVVAKDASGNVSVKETADQGPLGTSVGALTGGLIGLLGGPIGAGVGLATGALLGSWADLANLGVSGTFMEDISLVLLPGMTALVAEVDEAWVTPLDTRMEAFGGIVVREYRAVVEEEIALREANARKAEWAQLKAEHAQAKEAAKAKLQARVEAARAKFEAAADRAEARIDQRQRETEEMIRRLQAQAATATADAKARIDQRLAELRAEEDRRSALLKQAAALTKEALVP